MGFEGAIAQDVFDEYSDTGLGTSIGVGLSYRGWGVDVRRYSDTFDFDGNEVDVSGLIATIAVRLGDEPPKAAGRRRN